MSHNIYKSRAYGSLMIMGEHAVLYGKPAIVAAINKYIDIELKIESRQDNNKSQIIINTDLDKISQHKQDLHTIKITKPLEYVLTSIEYFKEKLLERDNSINISSRYIFTIKSDIDPTMGLGSSAAVTVAIIKVILDCLGIDNSKKNILFISNKIIQQVQGLGSGADLAASLYGGVLWYKWSDINNTKDMEIEKISDSLPIVVAYSGYKLSTKEVIAKIEKDINNSKSLNNIKNNSSDFYNNVFNIISDLVYRARDCIKNKDWPTLGQLFNQHYGLQEALGLSDSNLAAMVYDFRSCKKIYGSKISGSGLGDCVIALGECDKISNKILTDVYIG